VREAGYAAWRMGEVEVERVEELLCLEVFCAFAAGIEIESPKGDLVGGALFVLYPVGTAVAVAAEAVVIATAGTPIDQEGRYSKAGRLKCWEMIAHGKVIELTSGRWRKFGGSTGGCVLVRLPPPSDLAGTHAVCLLLCGAFRAC